MRGHRFWLSVAVLLVAGSSLVALASCSRNKAEREAAEWAKKVATLTQHCEAIKSSRSQRSSDRTTAKVLRLQLKLRLLAQKHEILALQENAIREEISTLQG